MSFNEPKDVKTNDDRMTPPSEQIPASRSKHRRWLWLPVLVCLLFGGYWVLARSQTQRDAAATNSKGSNAPSVSVVVASARTGNIPVYLNGLGSVTAFNTVTVKTRVDGQLMNLAFKEGDFVNQGDLLAAIDARPFEVQLSQGEGQLAHDQAQLDNANVDLARYQLLSEQDAIPKQQLDTQAALVAQLRATLRQDQAQIDSARLNLTYCRITSPISGRIGLRLVDAGNIVHAADANGLLIITQIQPIAVLFTIPEDYLQSILQRLRSGTHLQVEVYDREGKTKIATGTLLTVDNQIDQTTGTSRLKAVFENKDLGLFPNQFVNVRLLVEVKRAQVLVPSVAIQRGPQGTFVYVVKPDQTVETRPVVVGITEASEDAIETGLSAGEQVVVDGMDKLNTGTKVQVTFAPGPTP